MEKMVVRIKSNFNNFFIFAFLYKFFLKTCGLSTGQAHFFQFFSLFPLNYRQIETPPDFLIVRWYALAKKIACLPPDR